MKHLKSYSQHNEGIGSSLLKAGLAGSLLFNSPEVKSQETYPTTINQDTSEVTQIKMVNHLRNLRIEKSNDSSLNAILDEIKGNLNTKDSSKFLELFNKLSLYLESQYGYKIEARKIEDLDREELKKQDPTKFNLFAILGWLGSICLALCGVPQAIMSYKDRHSHGISWGFLVLWAFGELFALAYVYDKLDLPLLLNYAVNILIVGVILYFKVRPEVDPE